MAAIFGSVLVGPAGQVLGSSEEEEEEREKGRQRQVRLGLFRRARRRGERLVESDAAGWAPSPGVIDARWEAPPRERIKNREEKEENAPYVILT